MRYSDEIIEEVRQNNDVVDIISQYVHLTRKGRNYFGLCPFHSEKSPSFSVSPDRQIFHCFGCGVGGNVYTFLMKIEGITFKESLEQLAERANIQLPTYENSADAAKDELKAKVYKVNEFAAEFYHQNLYKPVAKIGQEYVKKRKMNRETLEAYRIGFSGKFDELYKALKAQGFGEKEILESGLVNKNANGTYIDRYRERLMFPICDARGKVIAFGGRILDDSKIKDPKFPQPKYINSPENVVYSKGRHLFGLNVAKKESAKKLLIVEGYMDVISLHQRGITNVVGALGTALTEQQGWLLRKSTEQVILGFDADGAGQTAIERSMKILQKMGCDMRVLQIEGAKDPDEYIVKFGEGRFRLAMDNAISLVEFTVKNLKKDLNLDNTSDKIKFLNEIAKILSKVENTMEREIYIEKIAKGYNISKEAIYAEVNKLIYAGNKTDKVLQSNTKEVKRVEIEIKDDIIDEDLQRRENTIIAILLENNNNIFQKIKEKIKPEDFRSEINKKIAKELYNELEKEDCNINKLIDTFDETMQSHITMLMATDFEIEDVDKAVEDILTKYEKERLENRKREILKQLEIEQDAQKKTQLGKELSNVIIALSKIR
ncbi:dNA primase [Clostridium sp. CAG:356]|jgi:DNA primase|nr:dNA primase [Clostridium sp. CAG:356]